MSLTLSTLRPATLLPSIVCRALPGRILLRCALLPGSTDTMMTCPFLSARDTPIPTSPVPRSRCGRPRMSGVGSPSSELLSMPGGDETVRCAIMGGVMMAVIGVADAVTGVGGMGVGASGGEVCGGVIDAACSAGFSLVGDSFVTFGRGFTCRTLTPL